MDAHQAKQHVEQLMGRRDAVKSEMRRAQSDYEKFSTQNLRVEAREAHDDIVRLQQRLTVIETELTKLKRYW